MKKKNIKDPKNPQGKKVPHQINFFVPQSAMPNLHTTSPIQCSSSLLEKNESYTPFAEPFEIPPEWVDKGEEEMNAELISRWNLQIHRDDHVFILGDFCWGKKEEWLQAQDSRV